MLAVVAGEAVLQSDVRAAREFGLVPFDSSRGGRRSRSAGQADRSGAGACRSRPICAARARRRVSGQQVANVRARFASPPAYADALARVGIEERHLREHVRQDLRMTAYLDQRFTTAPPSEDELEPLLPRTRRGVYARRRARSIRNREAGNRSGGDRRNPPRRRRRVAHRTPPPRRTSASSSRDRQDATIRNWPSCSRLKPAWLTMGATIDRRRR